MFTKYLLSVRGGNTHMIPMAHLEALQRLVDDYGAEPSPLFQRLGQKGTGRLQPVTARALLAELEKMAPLLAQQPVPGVLFRDGQGQELGRMYRRPDGAPMAEGADTALSAGPEGIRVVVAQIPPPAGFRSGAGMEAGTYECYFTRIDAGEKGWIGKRAPEMGQTAHPVRLAYLPIPPVTRWDVSRVAGRPEVASLEFVAAPAAEAFRDAIHALETACNESLRLRAPLQIRME